MGYTTTFFGSFTIDKPVNLRLYQLLHGLATTRRVKRKVPPKYGVDGEFYVDNDDRNIIDNNRPPGTQPSLYCGWLIQPDRQTIVWDGIEKFYEYVPWLLYIIQILKKNGYSMSGYVLWRGEETDDIGTLRLTHRSLTVMTAVSAHALSKKIIKV